MRLIIEGVFTRIFTLMSLYTIVKNTVSGFIKDDAITGAATVAFYSALSLAPLVLLFVSVASYLSSNAEDSLVAQFEALTGPQGAEAIRMIVGSAKAETDKSIVSTIVSFVVLAYSASAVFAQLQEVLNRIFGVEPKSGSGIWSWIRKRVFSMGILFSMGFMMLLSLVATTVLSLVFPKDLEVVGLATEFLVSNTVFTLFFSVLFKFLPDIRITWRDVFVGAAITSILFSIGKFAIGVYLGNSAVASAYGAAGSFIVLLLWVHYSSIVVFIGAELTKILTESKGHAILPNNIAVKVIR